MSELNLVLKTAEKKDNQKAQITNIRNMCPILVLFIPKVFENLENQFENLHSLHFRLQRLEARESGQDASGFGLGPLCGRGFSQPILRQPFWQQGRLKG